MYNVGLYRPGACPHEPELANLPKPAKQNNASSTIQLFSTTFN